MAITGKSKVKVILETPAALEIVKKYVPNIDDPNTMKAAALSLKALIAFPQAKVSKADQKACLAELEAANIE